MGKVVSLTVHKNTMEKRRRRACYDDLVKTAKEMPKDVDGWGLVYFKNNSDGSFSSSGFYYCTEPKDSMRIHDIASTQLRTEYLRGKT